MLIHLANHVNMATELMDGGFLLSPPMKIQDCCVERTRRKCDMLHAAIEGLISSQGKWSKGDTISKGVEEIVTCARAQVPMPPIEGERIDSKPKLIVEPILNSPNLNVSYSWRRGWKDNSTPPRHQHRTQRG
jgi:hypothetical protein